MQPVDAAQKTQAGALEKRHLFIHIKDSCKRLTGKGLRLF